MQIDRALQAHFKFLSVRISNVHSKLENFVFWDQKNFGEKCAYMDIHLIRSLSPANTRIFAI